MTDPERTSDSSTDDQFTDAVKVGAKRAGAHLIRAGIEVVSGIGAFLDELIKAKDGETRPEPPQRIELE